MIRALRALRGDLRIAARPACALILLGTAVIAGLSSAVMQDTSYLQLQNAQGAIQARTWENVSCSGDRDRCHVAREQGRRHAEAFLAEQQRVARRVGSLQSFSGTPRFAAVFMGLATGGIIVALLAGLTVAGEWSRRTMGLAFTAGVTPRGLAARRLLSLIVLGAIAFACAVIGAAVAAAWGRSARPLSEAGEVELLRTMVGGSMLLVAYAAIATAVTWRTRDALRAMAFSLASFALIAVTTPLGELTPGAAVASALGIDRVLELEIGYLWVWPGLTFPRGAGTPAHLVPGPEWTLAIVAIAALASLAAFALLRLAQRSDPLQA